MGAHALGAAAVSQLKFLFFDPGWSTQPALVNGAAGLVVRLRGRPVSVMGFTVVDGRIAQIDVLADPARVRQLDLPEP